MQNCFRLTGFFAVVTGMMVAYTNCSKSESPPTTSGAKKQAAPAGWATELALYSPGPSTTYGNWAKAITTDGAGYVDVVWLQGGSTPNDGSMIWLGTGSIFFAQSGDGGKTWSSSALTAVAANTSLPKITSVGSDLYVSWAAEDPDTHSLQSFFLHGIRNGSQVQWSTPQIVSDAPPGANAVGPIVAAHGSDVHIVWTDARSAGVTEIYYTKSQDRGSTWSAPVVISPVDGYNSWTPSIAVNANYVYVGWTDARLGESDCSTNLAHCHEVLYLRSSANSGQTWDTEVRLTCDSSIFTFAPSLFVEKDTLHIAFFQGDPSPPGAMNLYYLRGTNHGNDLRACSGTKGTLAKINVQYPSGDNVLSEWRPEISVYNNLVHMVWWGELSNNFSTGGQSKVYYSKSSDGVNWAAATSLTPQDAGSTYRSFAPNISLSADGSTLYTIWGDHRNDANVLSPNFQVFFRSGSF